MNSGYSKWIRTGAVFLFVGTIVFAFQNCSQPPLVDSEAQLESAAAKVDFAYESSIDQISYMSCAVSEPGTFDGGAYYSFRFGAYRSSGGVRLTPEFRTSHGMKPVERQASLLMNSPANSSTNIQFGIRQLANFQSMYTSTGAAVRGQDYVNVFEALGTMDLSDLLVRLSPETRVRYLRNGTVFGSRFEGSLYYTKNPTLAGSIRTVLRNDAFLAQTYSHVSTVGGGDTLARGPSDFFEDSGASSQTQVYGRGYTLRFGKPVVGANTPSHALFPDVVLQGVTERSLLNSTDNSGTWSCPETMRFRIARPEDVRANLVTCAMAPDPATLSQELALVRNQLRVEDWYVDMTNRCIVPKKGPATCYGSGATTVQYDITQTCNEGATTGACVSFATFCYRN
ncbi:MAG: hypothetical protein RBT63_00705 [Bdellovibrionales bacterium]|jgi:hypothetical protein|nr:hypothetical protein [Bdellovibrionales bacterium]